MIRLLKIFGFAFTVGFWAYVWTRYPGDAVGSALAATLATVAALILTYWGGLALAWVVGKDVK